MPDPLLLPGEACLAPTMNRQLILQEPRSRVA